MSASSEPPDLPWPPANNSPSASTVYGSAPPSLSPPAACLDLFARQNHAASTDNPPAHDST
eukprot:3494685-Ditylum_brightwellii.AAC.1